MKKKIHDTISNELSNIELNFENDADWDEIHRIEDINNIMNEYNGFTLDKIYDGNTIQKM